MSSQRQAAIGFIFITVLIDITGLGVIIPIMPTLITSLADVDTSGAAAYNGLIATCYSVMTFLFSPILGGISDRFGRRPVLLASLLGFGLDYILLALAPTMAWLFVGRTIAGIMGGSITTAMAYIADITPPEKRAENFGKVGAAFGLGFILGPVIGGLLGTLGPRAPFWFSAALALINCLYGFFILPESLKPENRRKFDWRRANPIGSLRNLGHHPVLKGFVIAIICVQLSAFAIQSTWSYYTIEKFLWDEKMIGISLAVVGIAFALVQGGMIRIIIKKLGQERSVYLGLFLSVAGFLLFAFATKSWMMFAFSFVYAFGGLAGPSMQGIMTSLVPADAQGELQGGLTSLQSTTALVGPLFMTQLFYFFTEENSLHYFPGAPMVAGAILALISAVWVYKTMRGVKSEI